ncbi:MAG: hypothetical protein LC708_04465, partial [Actinobacteria bacterium]|nr:hypothetical protein [Actinomycetota bacterium]
MKKLLSTASALALVPMPAFAQHAGHGQAPPAQSPPQGHAGHQMPAPAPTPPPPAQSPPQGHAGHQMPAPAPTPAQSPPHAGHQMPALAPAPAPAPAPTPQPETQPMVHQGHEAQDQDAGQGEHAMPGMEHGGMDHAMTGALGPYPMTREASGTAWQPDT